MYYMVVRYHENRYFSLSIRLSSSLMKKMLFLRLRHVSNVDDFFFVGMIILTNHSFFADISALDTAIPVD